MRWIVFVIVALVAIAIETSELTALMTLHGLGALYPSIVGVLIVFVSLFAPRSTALWAAWLAGLLMDLSVPWDTGMIIGPHALGYVFGSYFVLQLRTIVFRRKVLTVVMLTLLFLAASGVVEVTVLTIRSWFDGREGFATGFRPLVELFRRFGIAFYSAILAGVVFGWLLLQTIPMWSFQHSADRRRAWR